MKWINAFIKPPRWAWWCIVICLLCGVPIFYFKQMRPTTQTGLTTHDALLDETLRHVMIRHQGIYTLFGVKPMTLMGEVDKVINRDKEMEAFLKLPYKTQKKFRKIFAKHYREMPKFMKEKYSKEDVFFSDYHTDKLWKFWEENWEQYTGDQYFFSFRSHSPVTCLFINLHEVLYCLHRYYDDFKKTFGEDFSPDVVLEELKQGSSAFWNSAGKDDFLLGILLGYGEKSSRLFKLKNKNASLGYIIDLQKNGWSLHRSYLNVSDLALPSFRLFSLYDEQVSVFQRERERIMRFYSTEDFVEKTLSLLKHRENTFLDVVSGKTIPTQKVINQ